MKGIEIAGHSYRIILLLAVLCGVYRHKHFDKAARLFFYLTCLAFLTECIAYYAAWKYRNNLPVYNVFSLIEFLFLALYFNQSIALFRRTGAGIYIGITGIVWGICSLLFLQLPTEINSYFIFFESLAIVSISLYALVEIFQEDSLTQYYCYPHFWIPVLLTVYWTFSFINWCGYEYFIYTGKNTYLINHFFLAVNIGTYSAIAAIFLLYPKMKAAYAS